MKRIRLLLTLCFLTALLPLQLAAITFSYTYKGTTLDYEIITNNQDRFCQVVKTANVSGDIVLPEYIVYGAYKYTLVEIGDQAFRGQSITSISIPKTVTKIGNYAFNGCKSLTGDLIIPEGVTEIGERAFENCTGLKGGLVIPESLTSIGNYAFQGCTGFTGNLVIPATLKHIGSDAFNGCTGFKGNLIIKEGRTEIGNSAFYGCKGLIGDLVIPEGVTSIGDHAFQGCTGLTGNLIMPEGVTSIGDRAFYGCAFTGNLVIPKSVTSIGIYAFSDCTGFIGNLVIPERVTSIGDYAFNKCIGLTGNLVIPESVTSIGAGAFYKCAGLTGDLVIPEGVTSIGAGAFGECYGFNGFNLTLPSSLQLIGKNPFYGGIAFSDMYLHVDSPYQTSNLPSATRYHIPPKTYRSTMESDWSENGKVVREPFADPIDGVIYQWAYGTGFDVKVLGLDPALESLTIPGSIPEQIFGCDIVEAHYSPQECPNLTDITFDIETVPDNACAGLTKLKNVVFTENVKNIGANVLAGLRIDHITFGNENIPDGFADGIQSLRSVEFTENVKSIGANAFAGIELKSVTPLGAVPPTLGEGAFDKSDDPILIYLDETLLAAYAEDEDWNETFNILGLSGTSTEGLKYTLLSTDGDMAVRITGLSAKEGVTELVIPAAITVNGRTAAVTELDVENTSDDVKACTSLRIGDSDLPLQLNSNPLAAINNTKIRTVNIGRNLTAAPGFDEPLLAWRYLTTATFGEKVTEVPAKLFSGSTMLTNIDFSASNIETIGAEAFQSTTRLANIVLPDSLRIIGKKAFNGAGLTSCEFNDGLAQVCDSAFYNCNKLASLTLPSSTKYVGNGAFYGGAKSTEIKFNSSDNKFDLIDDYAFTGQIFPEAVTISAGHIGKNAFANAKFTAPATIKADRTANNAFKGSQFNETDLRIRLLGDSTFAAANIPDLRIVSDSIIGNPFVDATLAKAYIETTKYMEDKLCNGAEFSSIYVKADNFRNAFSSCKADSVNIEANIVSNPFYDLVPFSNEAADITIKADNIYTYFTKGSKLGKVAIIGNNDFTGYITARKVFFDIPEIGRENNSTHISCDSVEFSDNVLTIAKSAFSSSGSTKIIKDIKFGIGLIDIGAQAFYGHGCTSIEFPYAGRIEPVASIGKEAFFTDSETLKTVKLGNIVRSVGVKSFNTSRPLYYLDNLNLGQVQTIGENAFSLPQKVVIPGSVVSMESTTFWNVKSLSFEYGPDEIDFKPTFSNNLDYLRVARTFKSPQKINADRVILGDNPSELFDFKYSGTAGNLSVGRSTRSMTFSGATIRNTGLHIPASVTKIDGTLSLPSMSRLSIADAPADMPIDMSALTLTAPEATHLYQGRNLIVGQDPVGKLTSWKEVVFGDQVTAIPPYSFKGCAELTTAVLPPSIQSIGKEAFRDCASLTTIEFPESLAEVQQDAYFGCDAVEKVVARGMEPAEGDFAFAEDFMERVPLYVPEEAYEEYYFHPNFTFFYDYDHLLTLADGKIIENLMKQPNPDTEPVDEFKPGETHHIPSLWDIIKYVYKHVTGQHAPMRAAVDENGDATDIRLAWVSSNPDIASVDAEGYVTIHEDAPVEITAYATDGSGKKVSFLLNEEVLSGDANGDKVVDALDINAIINHIANPDAYSIKIKAGDINRDGVIDALDINAIINQIANQN